MIGIILLGFTIFLANKNIIIDRYKTKFYIFASITNIILLILEIADLYIATLTSSNIYIVRIIVNVFGFALSPLIPYFMLCFNNYYNTIPSKYFRIPLFINVILSLLSAKTGWVFNVDTQNNYSRGPLFLCCFIVNILYLLILIHKIFKDDECSYYLDEKNFIISIAISIIVCSIIQILFEGTLLILSSISASLILYYIFLRELQFRYDVFTGVRNRQEFDKNMIKAQNCDGVIIVVMDLNDLKEINDLWGHITGDQYIIESTKIIENSFKGIGICYRIGGDEFCVICKNTTDNTIKDALNNLEETSKKVEKNHIFRISIAYGYAVYNEKEDESIYEAFEHADQAMYLHKTRLKFSQHSN